MKDPGFQIQDVVNFVFLNRAKGRRKVFEDWTREQVALAVRAAINVDGFAYCCDEKNTRIVGIVLAEPIHADKVLHVKHCLGDTGALKKLIKCFKAMYEGYTITARRDGKAVQYRTNRLVQLTKTL